MGVKIYYLYRKGQFKDSLLVPNYVELANTEVCSIYFPNVRTDVLYHC